MFSRFLVKNICFRKTLPGHTGISKGETNLFYPKDEEFTFVYKPVLDFRNLVNFESLEKYLTKKNDLEHMKNNFGTFQNRDLIKSALYRGYLYKIVEDTLKNGRVLIF